MLRIGDFSRISQVSIRMLRYYDQQSLLRPSHVDLNSGYRYYDISQIGDIHRIVALKDMGFSTKEIGVMLDRDISQDEIITLLTQRKKALNKEITVAKSKLMSIESRLLQVTNFGPDNTYQVNLKPMDSSTIISVRTIVPTISDMNIYCYNMHKHLYAFLESSKVSHTSQEVTIYHNDSFTTESLDVEIGILINCDQINLDHLNKAIKLTTHSPYDLSIQHIEPADKAATIIYQGDIRYIQQPISDLLTWIGVNGYVPAGAAYEYHLSGPIHSDKNTVPNAVIEFMIPVIISKDYS